MVLLSACAGGAGKTKRVAVLTYAISNETTKYVCDKVQELGKAKGWDVTVTDTAGDFNMLNSRIEDAVTQKVDAIVLPMIDPPQVSKALDAALKAGIPVFGLDSTIAPGILLNVTSDNTSLGTLSAEKLVEAIGGKGNVIMLTHDPHPGVRERAEAAQAVFDKYPEIKVVEKKHVEVPGPLDSARKTIENLLVAYPNVGDIAGIWAGWDEPALGALQAAQAAGRAEIFITGVDGQTFAKAEIAKGGQFIATVGQDFDGMASKVVELIEGYFNGQKPTEENYKIPGTLITKENAQ